MNGKLIISIVLSVLLLLASFHNPVCANKKDFEHIIERIDNVYLIMSTKVSDVKHLDDFEWFSYTPHCKYFCESKPTSRKE